MKTTPNRSAAEARKPYRRNAVGLRAIARSRPSPAVAEALLRIRSKPGFLASLTQEQLDVLFGHEWPEVLGHDSRHRPRD